MVTFPTKTPKIGILRALQLGDLLCTIPAIRAIKTAFPTAQITLIGLSWEEDFAKRFSMYFDNFVLFPGYPGLPEQQYSYKKFLHFLQVMKLEQFDLLIQMQGSGTIVNNLLFLCAAKEYAGYYPAFDNQPTHKYFFPYPEETHEIYRWLNLINNLGIPSAGDFLEFPTTHQDKLLAKIFASKYSLQEKKYICFHPGSRNVYRRLSEENFAIIAKKCMQLGFQIVLTGVAAEKEISQKVCSFMTTKPIDLVGETSLGVAAEIVKNAALVITNDTGMSHVASAVKTPSIVLFNYSSPQQWAPLDKKIHKAITSIEFSFEYVLEEAEKLLKINNYYE